MEKKGKILIVDDNVDAVELLEKGFALKDTAPQGHTTVKNALKRLLNTILI